MGNEICRRPRRRSKILAAFDGYNQECKGIMTTIAARLQAVRSRIEAAAMTAGSSPADIRLIAVSKNFPPAAIAEAYAAGQVAFGENYLQEAVGKIATLSDLRLEWHGASPDGQSFEPDRNVRPSNGVRQRDVDGALGEAVELAHGSASSVARAGAPRSGASFPEGPLLRPLEWQAAHGRQDGKQREGGLR